MANYQNEWHKLRVNLLTSASWLTHEMHRFLQPYGITQKQFNILRILRGHKGEVPLSILEVRQKMLDRMSDASRIIDRLAQKGLLYKKPCTNDKRTTRILITEAGLQLLSQIDDNYTAMDQLLRGLTLEDARQLNAILDKLEKEGDQ